MRRIKVIAVLSLILLGATVFVWLRSYWRQDSAETAGPATWGVMSRLGTVAFSHTEKSFGTTRRWTTQNITPTWHAIRQTGFWFQYQTSEEEWEIFRTSDPPGVPLPNLTMLVRSKTLTIPYWFPTLLFVAVPAWWFFLHLRRRRILPGTCPTCHYDLRAHAPGQKCPECGTVIETAIPSPPK
jgi:hypothetical protein